MLRLVEMIAASWSYFFSSAASLLLNSAFEASISSAGKDAHYLDAGLHRLSTVQNIRRHNRPVFSEDERKLAPAAAPLL